MTVLDASGHAIRPADIARIRTRASLSGSQAWAYDAQVPFSQEMGGWQPVIRSPDSEINFERDRVVSRARDLIRNDGWATGSINRLLDAAVGAHFLPIPQPNFNVLTRLAPGFDASWAAEFGQAVSNEWRMWALDDVGRHNDAERQQTVTQQLRTALRHKLVDGDSLCMALWAPDRVGTGAARYATVLQVVNPDRLSNPYQNIDSHARRGGVEVDDLGAALGYHVRRAHQNDWYDAYQSTIWDYFPRETTWGRPVVIHDFDKDQAGQHRGNGILTAVLSRFKMLTKFDQVTLQAAVLRTLVGFFIKSPFDAQQIRDAMDAGDVDTGAPLEQSWYQGLRSAYHDVNPALMGGVRMPSLAPGEDIVSANAGGDHANDAETFQRTFLRSFAAATGQADVEISGDFSKMNYSSYRGASLQAWRTLIRRRTDFASGTATPIYCAWLEEALDTHLKGLLPRNAPPFAEFRAAYAKCMWIGPGKGWVDPVKERQGELLGLDAGFGTLAQTCAEVSGAYWRDVLDQRQVEEAEFRARKLTKPDWAGGNQLPAAQQDVKPQPQ
jgi:lambda family phage portal protein